jgi:glycerophosphoryl diester phosphodiesterase
MGVSSLEMDAAVTKDGVVVISHDPYLDPNITRGPGGAWIGKGRLLIKDLTFAQLQSYDVGRIRPETEYARRFPHQVPVDGTRIPSLSSVIGLVRTSGQTGVLLSVEAKYDPTDATSPTLDREPLARALIETITKEKFGKRTTIQSFDWGVLQIVQKIAPGIPTVYLTSAHVGGDTLGIGKAERSKWTGDYDVNIFGGSAARTIKAAGGRIWSPDSRDLDAAQVKDAHALGVSVIVWTVNDAARMARFIDDGVDGIITDYPDRLRRVMMEKGIALPIPAPGAGSSLACGAPSTLNDRG